MLVLGVVGANYYSLVLQEGSYGSRAWSGSVGAALLLVLFHALLEQQHMFPERIIICVGDPDQLRPAHKEARELHAHIVRLRSQLRSRESSRSREAFKKMMLG